MRERSAGTVKTPQEIAIMKQGGSILRTVMDQLIPLVRPGISTQELDEEAERLIRSQGALSSFKEVEKYRWTTCLPIDEQVVHTPPSDRILKKGELLTIDIGVYYKSYHTDYATTVCVGGSADEDKMKFLRTGAKALEVAIAQAQAGNRIGHISRAIENAVLAGGYFVIRELTGHAIGRNLHEDPLIPGYLDGRVEDTPSLTPGMTIAIEVIYSMGSKHVKSEKGNKWSLVTTDGSLSACFEKTVAISKDRAFVLT
ncbi:MAG TPA: type I methionyl aminopeptidase [Patescibacteria group bacterium]|nr:type I methionyl aminopeptidase [Patescibacteria group bacterium]